VAHGWAGADSDLETARSELHARRAPIADPPPRVTVSLIDRFHTVLQAGHRIARSLSDDAVFEALRDGALALLRAQGCAILKRTDADDADAQVVHGDAGPVSPAMVRDALASQRIAVRPSRGAPVADDETLARAAVRSALC